MKLSYMLRTCNADMTSFDGFLWPEAGPVEAPDWEPTQKCGYGLHGALHGEGDGYSFNWDSDAKWLVCAINEDEAIRLGVEKVKVPRAWVVFCGNQREATDYIRDVCNCRGPVIGATVAVGQGGTATAGDYGTATAGQGGIANAGDYGTATAGRYGKATAGHGGTATVGIYGAATVGQGGTATVGIYGTAIAGRYGKATAGHGGTAIADIYGTAIAGKYGKATAGIYGAATVGIYGTATVGKYGKATAGDGGTLIISYHCDKTERDKKAIAYVGEDNIKPNVAYKLDKNHKFVESRG